MRAAVILHALSACGPFPASTTSPALFTTPIGWMLIVGTLIGGLFAAFAFAISAFSVPMLLSERLDALTAMGRSMASRCSATAPGTPTGRSAEADGAPLTRPSTAFSYPLPSSRRTT